MAHTTFIGGLIRKPELMTSQRDGRTNYFMYLQLAENYQKRDQQNNYIDNGTFYKTVSVSGHVARMIEAANLQPGTRLLVVGDTYSVWRDEYTTKQQQVVPGHFEEQIRATHVGLDFSGNQSATVFKVQTNGTQAPAQPPVQNSSFSGGTEGFTSQPTQQTPDFSRPMETTSQPADSDDFSAKFSDFFNE